MQTESQSSTRNIEQPRQELKQIPQALAKDKYQLIVKWWGHTFLVLRNVQNGKGPAMKQKPELNWAHVDFFSKFTIRGNVTNLIKLILYNRNWYYSLILFNFKIISVYERLFQIKNAACLNDRAGIWCHRHLLVVGLPLMFRPVQFWYMNKTIWHYSDIHN